MTTRRRTLIAAVLGGALALPVLPVGGAVAAPPADLFFSEYIEGSSNNKALELYNGTGAPVDLAAGGYNVQMYFNGSTGAGLSVSLTGTVADGDVFVLAQSSADPAVLAQADQTNGAGWFNGDDAVVLRRGATVLDVIGEVGVDPGSEWGSGEVSTQDNTLRRLATTCAGDPDGANAFDPAAEWAGFPVNTFDGLGAHTADCGTTPPAKPTINEFSASTSGVDGEYVEVHGVPSTDYSAHTILEIEGDATSATGTIDEVIPVGSTDADGFWLADLPANSLENGTITLLLVQDFTGAAGNDLDPDDDGSLDVTPWSAVVDAVAVTDGGSGDLTYGMPVLAANYDGKPFAPGGSSRIPDGFDTDTATDWVRNDFDLAGIPGYPGSITTGEAYNTPGAANVAYSAPPEACGDPSTPIHDVQGSGPASPIVGADVAVEGVVVADFQTDPTGERPLRGFHVQDPVGDGDPATSEGIFVFAPTPEVNVGDAVRVRGTVAEFGGLTEITAVEQVWTCSTGNGLPPATGLVLPVTTLDEFEQVEGMLVTFPQALSISEYFNFDRFGEIVLTSERQYQPTAVFEPGSAEAADLATANALARITLDDGRTSQNPDPALHPNGNEFDLANTFRGGDTVANVTGAMDYAFGQYRIQPTQGGDHAAVNARPESPDAVGGSVQVASMNVLNYFLTLDLGADVCGPQQDLECRGADDAEELTRQRAKILGALEGIDADVVGLIEMENTPGVEPAADLVAGLNAAGGAGTYDYIDTGVIGTDAIRVGLIYKPDVVQPLGDFAILDSTVDPRFLDTKNRPVLAQTFESAGGRRFTVAVNHLKSKGSDCDDLGDPDLGDGAGNCNVTRTQAAQALVDWLAADPTGSGTTDALIVGDLNSYDQEDPIDALVTGGYTDLVAAFGGERAYSYVFDGQLGYLDYALASSGLTRAVTGASVWHVNADEPDILDYDTSFKKPPQQALYEPNAFRSSDHDPVIVGLDLEPPSIEVSVSPDTLWPPNHKYVDVQATVTVADDVDPDPTVTLVSVTSNEPDDGEGDGSTVDDIVIVDETGFKLRAERSGMGVGRVYTITYAATDSAGNTAQATATVTVPRNRSTGTK